MKFQYFTMIGLAFDLVGALLVAVEAIGIGNFRKLRDQFLKTAHSYTLSPRIVIVDENGQSVTENPKEERSAESFPGVFQALHYVTGFLVLILANSLLDGWIVTAYGDAVDWILGLSLYLQIPVVLFFLLLLVFFVFWGLGKIVHRLLWGALLCTMKVIDFIDAKTRAGTIGILGFLLLAVGFSLLFIGSYLSIE
jgi:hypothetical protein